MRAFAIAIIAVTFLVAAHAAAAQEPATRPPTAQQVIDAIVRANAVTLPADTVDTIKAGDPNTPVTGVVTTFMDTFAVLRKAVAAGDNLVITHEPTFYNHPDSRALFPDDPVVAAKLAYIEQHHLVVWRFHDGWHLHRPDGIMQGEVARLGWETYRRSELTDSGARFQLPATTVGALAATLRERLNSPVVRVIGDPAMTVSNVALLPGAAGLAKQVKLMERDDVEALIVGEAPEWEAVEYARDATAEARAGASKVRARALIVVGHEPSEEAGMAYCATWLKPVLQDVAPGVRIDFIPAGSPFSDVLTNR